jgi:hypothetical protein
LLLPLTSFPLLARLIQTDTVAAPSAALAGLLLVFWLIPYLLRGGRIPSLVIPFLAFLSVALVASARAHFLDMPPFKGRSVLGEELDAFLTLAAGAALYIVAASFPRRPAQLKALLRLINWSGMVVVAWSLLQALFVLCCGGDYPDWMVQAQSFVSLRRLFDNRVTGLAYEPSWLAHQLNMVYLPFWLGAVVARNSAHPRKFFGVSVESLLLVGGAAVLFLSFSRVGWLSFFLVLAVLLGRWAIGLIRRFQAGVASRVPPAWSGFARSAALIGLPLLLLALFLGVGILLIQVGSLLDPRLGNMYDRITEPDNFYALVSRLAIAERVIFWETGWRIFGEYPFLGVGLGNAGFFFPEHIPDFGWRLTEVNDIFFRRSFLPNTKNLWVRLLAETGLAGFAVMSSWLLLLWRTARQAVASRLPFIRTYAWAGLFALLALLVEGFSVDSFALPYIWIALGFLTAALWFYVREEPAATHQQEE